MKKFIIIFGTVFSIVGCEAKIVIPEQLKKDERLVVNYKSLGCYKNSHYILVFNEESVTVYKSINKKIGTVILTVYDKKRLNRLFSFYEKEHGKGCTTVDTIRINYYKGNNLFYSKDVIDASCELGTNVLGFEEIITRASY